MRGQYAAVRSPASRASAYRDEPNVAPNSNVETFVAMRLADRQLALGGRAVLIRTGKHLSQRKTEIAIRFKQAPYTPFRHTPVFCLPDNWLIISIAPDEGISLQFAVKRPGPVVDARRRADGLSRQRLVSERAERRVRNAHL